MSRPRNTVVERLSDYPRLLEIGIGRRTGVAAALAARGADVRATDIKQVDVPDGVRFRVEDVTAVDAGDLDEFHRVDAVYARNCPPELHRPIRDLARAVDAAFLFTTLGFDEPTIPVSRESQAGETLYVAASSRGRRRERERR